MVAAEITICGQTSEDEPLRGAASLECLANILESLSDGMTELGCHPGCTEEMNSPYCQEREIEVQTLCDPEIRTILRGLKIEMQTFAGVRGRT